jgi:hypothetical protein
MTTQVVCVYTVPNTGNVAPAAIATLMTPPGGTTAYLLPVAEPNLALPWAWLWSLGVLLTSDVIASLPTTKRTVTLGLVPTVLPTMTAALVGSSVSALTIGVRGSGLTAPLVISTTGGGSPFPGNSPPAGPAWGTSATGAGAATSVPPARNANIYAPIRVLSVALANAGTGYSATPTCAFVGGLGPSITTTAGVATVPTAATGTVTTDGAGHLTGIVMTTPGVGYIAPPVCVVSDPTGINGNCQVPVMEMDTPTIVDGGFGYGAVPTVVVTPKFKYLFPDAIGAAAQAKPFFRLLNVLNQFLGSPESVFETAPAVT